MSRPDTLYPKSHPEEMGRVDAPRRGLHQTALHLKAFVLTALDSATSGERRYHLWMGALTIVMLVGGYAYFLQLRDGLAVTGMTDHVSWGLYISNFAFLVGLAAAAMMVVLPAYILEDVDFGQAVLMAEGVAVAALVMCLAFVVVDLGNPFASWHLIPGVGLLNWPRSLLAWDVIVLNGYLALNLAIPFYLLYSRFTGNNPDKGKYVPWIYIAVFWAVSIHLVTAFLFSGLPARPFWHNALLGPRFLASAFAAGPAFMILLLWFIRANTEYDIRDATFAKLAMITAVAAQVNLIMLGSEVFTEFYFFTHHAVSAQYLFFGLNGHNALVPWIWGAIILNVGATAVLSIHPLRRNSRWLMPACLLLFLAIWTEKGMGLVIPGFVPSPLGEIVEYAPTWVELAVTAGIWALGLFILTVLVRVALPIELGRVRSPYLAEAPAAAGAGAAGAGAAALPLPGPPRPRMRPILQGILWLAVYLGLVLAPLVVLVVAPTPPGGGFWWDVAIGLGFAGLVMMGIQFLLTARFRRAAAPYGIDIIYYFHRMLAYALVGFVLAHPLILIAINPALGSYLNPLTAPWEMTTGLAALLLLLVLVATSVFRKQFGIPYEWWRLAHLLAGVVAIALAFTHILPIAHYTGVPVVRRLWIGIGLTLLAIVVWVRVFRPWALLLRPYRVTNVRPDRGESWILSLEPEDHDGIRFQPGQFAWVTLRASPFAMREHPFSFASSPSPDGRLEFAIKELGDFTLTVGTIEPGEVGYVDGPYGSFSIDRHPDAPGYVFLAGGIGIAPIVSMLRALAERGDSRPHVLFTAHSEWDRIPLRDEVERLSDELNLKVIHVLEEPPADWTGEVGWITRELLDRHLPGNRGDLVYFACGPVPMLRAVESFLGELGIGSSKVHSELFDLV